ncbi:MAG: hypothetical protein H8K10_15595 [Nitrospira sp.]|nr:hypothetical protein [Nitrospira sp.]
MRTELLLMSFCFLVLALIVFCALGHRELGLLLLGLAVYVRPPLCVECRADCGAQKGGDVHHH